MYTICIQWPLTWVLNKISHTRNHHLRRMKKWEHAKYEWEREGWLARYKNERREKYEREEKRWCKREWILEERERVISLQLRLASRVISTFLLFACFRLSPAQARTDESKYMHRFHSISEMIWSTLQLGARSSMYLSPSLPRTHPSLKAYADWPTTTKTTCFWDLK